MSARVCGHHGCPTLIARGDRYCPDHTDKGHRSTWRDRGAQAKFRAAVLAKAGNQCEFLQLGIRCTVTDPAQLQAHHREPGNDDPATGRALCIEHHRRIDPHAR